MTVPIEAKSIATTAPRRAGKRIAAVILSFLGIGSLVLALVPWQQTVIATGEVGVYNPGDRPQTIEAQISGRIVEWRVGDGDKVRKGEVIARIADIDSKFLDEGQTARLKRQRDFAATTRDETLARAEELRGQQARLRQARESAIAVAQRAVSVAVQSERAAEGNVRAQLQNVEIARRIANRSADERKLIAQDAVVQARQALQASRQELTTRRQLLDRQRLLAREGLAATQNVEIAQNNLVKAETDVERARQSFLIAERNVKLGVLSQESVGFEIERARAALETARAARDGAAQNVAAARIAVARLEQETLAGIAGVGASLQSALESAAKNAGDLEKVEIELGNLRSRRSQQVVRAPRDGRVARILKGGSGQTVKAGDPLCTVLPFTQDRIVELTLTGNDVRWVSVGRPVRLMFSGWPAVQLAGYPGASSGTFGGRVAVMDPVDDGKGSFRVLVRETRMTLPGGRTDPPWPDAQLLRPGVAASGWVLLDQVPLGFELWRQFNGFPPNLPGPKTKPPGGVKVKSKA